MDHLCIYHDFEIPCRFGRLSNIKQLFKTQGTTEDPITFLSLYSMTNFNNFLFDVTQKIDIREDIYKNTSNFHNHYFLNYF